MIPYASEVRKYVNPQTKTIITSDVKDKGKGWFTVRVGSRQSTVRGYNRIESEREKLLQKHYPNYDPVSLFSETSYHSSLTQGNQGKVTSYGTEPYTKQFSAFKPIDTFRFEQPVKTESPQNFGDVLEEVQINQWRYVVIDWIPQGIGKSVLLQVRDTIDNPLTGEKRVLFKSKKFKESEKDKVYKIFNQRVNEAKRW
jgi:hypothetical protein